MKKKRIHTRPRRYIYRHTVIEKAAVPNSGAYSWEKAVKMLASLSQTGLLLLAVVGYFYTVRPVYEKALLDEEIAKTKIELRETEKKILDNNQEVTALKLETSKLRSGMRAEASRTKAATRQAQSLQQDLSVQYRELLPRLLNEFESIAFTMCRGRHKTPSDFSTCIEHDVLPTGNLFALRSRDRSELLKNSRAESKKLPGRWEAVSGQYNLAEANVERQLSSKSQRCKELESKENIDTASIQLSTQCRMEVLTLNSELFKKKMDRIYAEEAVTSNALKEITSSFYSP